MTSAPSARRGLDDRLTTWSARHFTETPWYNRAKAVQAWTHYLGGQPATPYAAPSRAEDLSDYRKEGDD